jgi:predicted phosphoribosyltransferase
MIHLPFEDRVEAGRLLARELSARRVVESGGAAVVLALARGGVPVGFEIADRLHLPLDVIVVRKVGVPWQPELAMGAITGQVRILDDPMIRELGISDAEVEDIIAREQVEMKRREEIYRAGQPALDLHGRSAILVDDGLATGNTLLAAVRHVRSLDPGRIVIAVPVGSSTACARLRGEADDVVCLATPDHFFSVGEWYRDFEQVSDAEVRKLLAESRLQLQRHPGSAAVA